MKELRSATLSNVSYIARDYYNIILGRDDYFDYFDYLGLFDGVVENGMISSERVAAGLQLSFVRAWSIPRPLSPHHRHTQ